MSEPIGPLFGSAVSYFQSTLCPQFNEEQAKRDANKTGDIQARVARNNRHKKETPEQLLAKQPKAYALFCQFALEAASNGVTILGAKAVAERIRWESTLKREGEFKINNSAVSAMARKFMAEYPQYPLFKTRGKKECA